MSPLGMILGLYGNLREDFDEAQAQRIKDLFRQLIIDAAEELEDDDLSAGKLMEVLRQKIGEL